MNIPCRMKLKFGADPLSVTKSNFDKTAILQKIISDHGKEEILSQFQAGFILFVLGQSYEGFEHWKRVIELLCRSEEALRLEEFTDFFSNFVVTLVHQIDEVGEDFFEDIVSGTNFLSSSLSVRPFFPQTLYI